MAPDTVKGGSVTLNGVVKDGGGGSVIHVTVRSFKKAEMCSDYEVSKHEGMNGDKSIQYIHRTASPRQYSNDGCHVTTPLAGGLDEWK